MEKIKVVLIDDHTLFRNGLKFLLDEQEDFEVIGEADDGLGGVKLVKQTNPDIVLLDLDMPTMNGKDALKQILNQNPKLAVLMLTVSEDANNLSECIQIGARGYLLKTIDIDFLLESIRKCLDGDNVLSPEMTSKLVLSFRNPKSSTSNVDKFSNLTPREMETLVRLSKGESNKVIARELDVTESTVKVYVQSILRKLNLKSRLQAAIYAVENGLGSKE